MPHATPLAIVVAAAVLGGCTFGYDIERMRTAEAEGSAFTRALAEEYRAFTVSEADVMYDWPDAGHFARKGLEASRGTAVAPEPIEAWRLPGDKVEELRAARGELIEVLEASARDKAPGAAARAQGRFDCWIEQQEENHQPAHIAACREGFRQALDEAKAALAPEPEPEAAEAAEPEAEAQEELAAVEPQSFTVYFAFDSAEIGPEARAVIAEAAAAVRAGAAVRVSLTGHADRAGPEAYNRRLSLARARAVREALAGRGIAGGRMSLAARGESEPAVPTADGVREPANRRVEILVD